MDGEVKISYDNLKRLEKERDNALAQLQQFKDRLPLVRQEVVEPSLIIKQDSRRSNGGNKLMMLLAKYNMHYNQFAFINELKAIFSENLLEFFDVNCDYHNEYIRLDDVKEDIEEKISTEYALKTRRLEAEKNVAEKELEDFKKELEDHKKLCTDKYNLYIEDHNRNKKKEIERIKEKCNQYTSIVMKERDSYKSIKEEYEAKFNDSKIREDMKLYKEAILLYRNYINYMSKRFRKKSTIRAYEDKLSNILNERNFTENEADNYFMFKCSNDNTPNSIEEFIDDQQRGRDLYRKRYGNTKIHRKSSSTSTGISDEA